MTSLETYPSDDINISWWIETGRLRDP